ncbi:glutathione S-transferase theta-1-like [Myxocyprinus asiaticus]|uniref:glutathione S-transferase theta-1-like n=1 Tax=Myxocyprinus asiaticus TaxID=70543 RepID=UPI0022230F1E|nr:glutathione S-transferase theta-1-like [Myxocyprinus asiaticus]
MPLELHLDLHSQPCRSVFVFAKITKIPFEYKAVDLAAAILQYLAAKHCTPDHWYPADLQKRARFDEYLSWQHTNIRANGSKVFWFRAVLPVVTGAPVPKEKMDSAMEDLNLVLKIIEEKFLQDRPFITGEKISLADIVAIEEMMQQKWASGSLLLRIRSGCSLKTH